MKKREERGEEMRREGKGREDKTKEERRHKKNRQERTPENTHNEVSNDECQKEKRNGGGWTRGLHAVPEGLDPLAAQNAKHHHERVLKVQKVPPRHAIRKHFFRVVLSVNFHSHHGKNIDDQRQDKRDVSDGANAVGDCGQQFAHGLPRLG